MDRKSEETVIKLEKPKLKLDSVIYDDEIMDTMIEEICHRFTKERISRGLSVDELAKLVNLNKASIYRIEKPRDNTGKYGISLPTFLRLSVLYNKSPESFIPIEEYERPMTIGEKIEMELVGEDPKFINLVLDFIKTMKKYNNI